METSSVLYSFDSVIHYLRERFYNPVIDRISNEDTYDGDGLDLYVYCDNISVNFVNQSGHDDCFIRKMDTIHGYPISKTEYLKLLKLGW